ncbi:DUF4082 domain-containing protein [Amycolatopsis lurida]
MHAHSTQGEHGTGRRYRPLLLAAVLFVLTGCLVAAPVPFGTTAQAQAACANKIACENEAAGTDDWQVSNFDDTIAGFTTDISATPGSTVTFKVKTSAPGYSVTIYRLGYYQGKGARYMGTATRNSSQSQPACLTDPTGLLDCGNWAPSVTWTVPANATSGLYYAVLRRSNLTPEELASNPPENEIAFVVRDDASTSKVLFQTSDSTWQAYNTYGNGPNRAGNSMYFTTYGEPAPGQPANPTGPGPQGSAYKVSYNRPLYGQGDENFIFNAEFPMLKFMERNGYDMSYTTDVDSARRGHLIKNHKVFMAVGHDEYWSKEQRSNVEAARDAGVHLAFMTGNEVFWKTRWEPSIAGTPTDWRTLVCYKETKHDGKIDPHPDWTGTWRDARYSPPSDGGKPENALLGNIFTVNGKREDALTVPSAYGKMRLWRNTAVAQKPAGDVYTFKSGTLGYEWNSVEDNGFTPPGTAQLSRTTVTMDGFWVLQNEGDEYGSGTKTHALTLYRHPSGSLVFGAGTVQWAWGLDNEHAFPEHDQTADLAIQQATVNLMADMGVQPTTLMSGLVAASASTDAAAPVVAITSAPPTTVGTDYTIAGTVTDASGKVAGVEVSVDDGVTWHPGLWTAGTTNWQYKFTPATSGTPTVKVRAVDDSANLSAPVSRVITVNMRTCPCSIWTSQMTPANPAANDAGAIEVGVKWRAAADGYVRGIKFYKGQGNTGTHTGSLWTKDGRLLGTGTFTNETATGWQTLTLPTSVPVTAGVTYVASYYAPNGRYSADNFTFTNNGVSLDPLTALKSGVDGTNGVFKGGGPGFPQSSYQDTNYWVDVVWALDPGPDTRAPMLLSTAPLAGETSVSTASPPVSVTFDENVAPSTVQFSLTYPGGTEPGTVSTTGGKVTFTPQLALDAGTVYTATVRASDASGNAAQQVQWQFTTGSPRPAACPCTVWDDFTHPVNKADPHDSSPVELGTKVRFDGKGNVLGVRFYKGPGNTGTHTGTLWNAAGQPLRTGTFVNESAVGWQTLVFSSPVQVQANTTYVVSYYAPNGHYAGDNAYFRDNGADYGGIRALAEGIDGGNGVYRYGSGGGFPQNSWGSTNYWVDVIFQNGLNGDTTPPAVTGRTPASAATNVPLTSAVSATFNEPIDLSSVQFTLQDPGLAKLSGTAALSADQKTVTWTPSARLAPGTTYTANLKVADANGNAMPTPTTWSFTTTTTPACPCSLFSAATVPTVEAENDSGSYELGVRFSSSVPGTVTGVKFYKGAGNTGTHTGSLWTAGGQLVASGTFVNETATGWQTLLFATPVSIQAGESYIASYTAPNGHYAADGSYFERTAVTSTPLTAGATGGDTPNGVYHVGPGFPQSSFRGANYWVDVVWQPAP